MKRLRHLKALKKKTLRHLTASEEKKPGTLKSQVCEKSASLDSMDLTRWRTVFIVSNFLVLMPRLQDHLVFASLSRSGAWIGEEV
jgi:hypothetical protein